MKTIALLLGVALGACKASHGGNSTTAKDYIEVIRLQGGSCVAVLMYDWSHNYHDTGVAMVEVRCPEAERE